MEGPRLGGSASYHEAITIQGQRLLEIQIQTSLDSAILRLTFKSAA